MQFMEVGGWMWTVLLSVEIAAQVRSVGRHLSKEHHAGIFRYRRRLAVYHAVVLTHSAVTTVLMYSLGFMGEAGEWCWSHSELWKVQTYATLWLGFVVIIMCSATVVADANVAFPQAVALSSGNRVSEAFRTRHDMARAAQQKLLLRFMIIPLGYILLHIPGTLNRCSSLFRCARCSSPTIVTLQGVCDPSQGTLNFILFGALDSQFRREVRSACETWGQHLGISNLLRIGATAVRPEDEKRAARRKFRFSTTTSPLPSSSMNTSDNTPGDESVAAAGSGEQVQVVDSGDSCGVELHELSNPGPRGETEPAS